MKKGKSLFPELNDKKWLIQKHCVEDLTSYDISKIIKCKSKTTILNAIKKFNIPSHEKARNGEKNGMFGVHLKGEKSGHWQGGKIKRICEQCGAISYIALNVMENGGGKYCSHSCARQNIKIPTHHTKPELIFEQICKKNNLPFKYTGDGAFWIGKNPSINPDFVECNGKKIAVEIFGDYWHSPLLNPKLREDRTLPHRKKTLKQYGWKLIIFWESDLKREDAEQFVLNKLGGI